MSVQGLYLFHFPFVLFVAQEARDHVVNQLVKFVCPGQKHVLRIRVGSDGGNLIGPFEKFHGLHDKFVRFFGLDAVKLVPKGKVSDRLWLDGREGTDSKRKIIKPILHVNKAFPFFGFFFDSRNESLKEYFNRRAYLI